MFTLFSTKKQKQDKENKINLDDMGFRFSGEYKGKIGSKECIYDIYAIALMMHDLPESWLREIRKGLQISDGGKFKNMDDSTFKTLIEYSNRPFICSKNLKLHSM